MTDKFSIPMPCTLEVRTAPSKSHPGALRVDATLDLPTAQIGLGLRAYFNVEDLPADPRQFLIDQSNLNVRLLLQDLIQAKRLSPNLPVITPTEPDRIQKLERELTELKAKYDALFLGKIGVTGDPL
jgi:hypothetical protein